MAKSSALKLCLTESVPTCGTGLLSVGTKWSVVDHLQEQQDLLSHHREATSSEHREHHSVGELCMAKEVILALRHLRNQQLSEGVQLSEGKQGGRTECQLPYLGSFHMVVPLICTARLTTTRPSHHPRPGCSRRHR